MEQYQRISTNFQDEYLQSLHDKYSIDLSPNAENKTLETSPKLRNGKVGDSSRLQMAYTHNVMMNDSSHENQPKLNRRKMDTFNQSSDHGRKRRLHETDSHLETMSLRKKRKLESIAEKLKAKSEVKPDCDFNAHTLRSVKTELSVRKNGRFGHVKKKDFEEDRVDANRNLVRDHIRGSKEVSPNQINLKEFYSSSIKDMSDTSPFKGKMSAFEISLLKGKQSVERRKSLEAATLRSSPRLNVNVAANQHTKKRSARSLTPSLNEKSLTKRAAKTTKLEKRARRNLRDRSKSLGAVSPSSIENQLVLTKIRSTKKRRSLRNQNQKQAAKDTQKAAKDSPQTSRGIRRHHSLGCNTKPGNSPSSPTLTYSNRLNGSPKLKGLPAVLSLNTLSGIPQRVQGSVFSSSMSQGLYANNVSGTPPSLPTMKSAALLEDAAAFFHPVTRPSSLPIGQIDNDQSSFGIQCENNKLDHSEPVKYDSKLNYKHTQINNSNREKGTKVGNNIDQSHIKSGNMSGTVLATGVSDGRQSRRSSRSSTPNVSPLKTDMLTPSSTPCSTPRKSPSPGVIEQKSHKRNKKKNYLFAKSDDVLARWHDGLFYLGKILRIDEPNTKCLLRYEDNSEFWSLFKDIHRMVKEEEICCICLGELSEAPNEIVICDNCNQGYHQQCHSPHIDPHHVIDPDDEWFCRQCVFLMTVKVGGAIKDGSRAEDLKKMKQILPYDLSSLTWDSQHKNNIEQKYCYCGGPGIWYQKMLQCCRCKQWFHEACLQCLECPLLFGDSFFIFVCSPCNSGQEYIKRLDVDWADLMHIVLFNLALERRRKYFDIAEEILPWMEFNWNLLHVTEKKEFKSEEVEEQILSVLQENKSRFTNGSETRKKVSQWGLRVRVAPPRIQVDLPINDVLTDTIMKRLQIKGRRSKVFIPLECKSPVKKICASPSHSSVANRNLNSQLNTKIDGTSPLAHSNDHPSYKSSRKPRKNLPLLDKLIPIKAFNCHCHPFKTEIEQEIARDQLLIRKKIWDSYQSHIEGKSAALPCDETSSDGPPVLEKVEPVLPTCSNDSPPMPVIKDKKKKGKVTENIEKEKDDKVYRRSSRKLSNPPNILEAQADKTEISVKKVKSADGNYFCAYDKLGFGQGFHVLGRRVNGLGKVEYFINWDY